MNSRFSKVLATIGPASRSPDMLALLHDVGVDAFRLNFSHGTHGDHGHVIDAIRQLEKTSGRSIAIVADMQGPKIRCGSFPGGSIDIKFGQIIDIVLGNSTEKHSVIPIPHHELISVIEVGHCLKFDDGKLQVTIIEASKSAIKARVDVPGQLKNNKGINVVDAILPVSAMTEKDEIDIDFALSKGVDFIALSFVQSEDDVLRAKARIKNRAKIIVKLEKPSAIENLDEILSCADAAMVARGDLGVEIPLETVPIVQKRIIQSCRALGKPVIVATHMLESMIDAPTPTRAEASDVATAIYQGADAVMLSAETAVGRHPATAVAVMDRIIKAVEMDSDYWRGLSASRSSFPEKDEYAVGAAITLLANSIKCKAVFGYTKTGSTACRISRERPPCNVFALTPESHIASQLVLSWGITPIQMPDPENFDLMVEHVQHLASSELGLSKGDKVIISAGIPFGHPDTTNTLNIATIP